MNLKDKLLALHSELEQTPYCRRTPQKVGIKCGKYGFKYCGMSSRVLVRANQRGKFRYFKLSFDKTKGNEVELRAYNKIKKHKDIVCYFSQIKVVKGCHTGIIEVEYVKGRTLKAKHSMRRIELFNNVLALIESKGFVFYDVLIDYNLKWYKGNPKIYDFECIDT